MNDLGQGLGLIRINAETPSECTTPEDNVGIKFTYELHMECRKFLMYTRARIRSHQWVSLHRIRALLVMITDHHAHAA